jgi:hypothetical protein
MANTTKKSIEDFKSIFTIPDKIVTYTSEIKGMDKVIASTPIQNTGIIAGATQTPQANP